MNRLGRSQRLTSRKQFVRLFDQPGVYRGGTFQAFWKDNKTEKKAGGSPLRSRLGITIKGRPSSIWRTRIKRVVREWFRTHQSKFESLDLNIVLRVPHVLNWTYVDRLRAELKVWKK